MCPKCESKIASLDKLKPDEEARQSVETFVKSELEKSKEANDNGAESDPESSDKKVKVEATEGKQEEAESAVSQCQAVVPRRIAYVRDSVYQSTPVVSTAAAGDQLEKAGTPEPGEITGDDAQAGANMAAMDANFDINAMNMMGMMMNPMMQYQALQMQAAQVGSIFVPLTYPCLILVYLGNDGSTEPSTTATHAHATDDATSNA